MIDELISIALIQCCTGLAIACGLGGMDWITQGNGLHPLFAGVCVATFMLIPYFVCVIGRLSLAQQENDDETT